LLREDVENARQILEVTIMLSPNVSDFACESKYEVYGAESAPGVPQEQVQIIPEVKTGTAPVVVQESM
jgi:hypothetical protein